jgi:Mce-associated membrane protein
VPQRANQTRSSTLRSASTRRNQPGQRRRPKVAGQSRQPSSPSPEDGLRLRTTILDAPVDAPEEQPSVDAPDQQSDVDTPEERPARPRGRRRIGHRVRPDGPVTDAEPQRKAAAPAEPRGIAAWPRKRRLLALATALGVSLGLAGWFGYQTLALRTDPVARNVALVDLGASTQAISQVSTAMERVYSFDYTRLDENERVAKDMITPEFADDFATLFEQVRKLAPQQQAVVSATVAMAAVKELEGDRAVLVLFLDQQATRGADAKQLLASGRVTVSSQLIDGRWKIAGVDSR